MTPPPTDPNPPTPPAPISLRAYAMHRGCSVQSVSKAITSGRLTRSVVRVKGVPKILDVALADQEWAAATDLSRAPGSVKTRAFTLMQGRKRPVPQQIPPPPTRSDTSPPADDDGPAPEPPVSPDAEDPYSLAGASAREKHWRAKLVELQFQVRSGELIPAKAVESRLVTVVMQCKTKLLGLPRKVKAAAPHLTHADVVVIDQLIREALEDLSVGFIAPDRPDGGSR